MDIVSKYSNGWGHMFVTLAVIGAVVALLITKSVDSTWAIGVLTPAVTFWFLSGSTNRFGKTTADSASSAASSAADSASSAASAAASLAASSASGNGATPGDFLNSQQYIIGPPLPGSLDTATAQMQVVRPV